ncbi:hypothetical protein [Micromonospora sp. KLBMP9576]|uniref:hypothetical protein n=1 Tax=Micromonospora sp. KLBMP9576 TaxID=3424769 RepID=UPI003D91D5CF
MTADSRKAARITVTVFVAMLVGACGTGQRDTAAPSPQAATAEPAPDTTTPAQPGLADARIAVPDSYLGAGERIHDVDPDAARITSTRGVAGICLDRPGRVTINEIRPEMSTGSMRVEAFALIPPGPSGDDSQLPPLSREPVALEGATACAQGPDTHALRLRVRKLGPRTAVAERLVLHYTSGGRPYEFPLRWSVALCAPYDVTTRQCEPVG